MIRTATLALCFGALLRSVSRGESETRTDKSEFNLFHPTPNNLLRSFSADRPSQSTGPYTVDAGHFYLEISADSYLFDEPGGGTRVERWNVAPFNFRIGLTNDVELDFAYADYIHLRIEDRASGKTETHDGLGDFVLQAKINLLGNDGGKVALSLIPFLKIPTNTNGLGNDSVEGGLGIPFQAMLPGGLTLALETGAQAVRNDSDTGYDPAFFNAVLLSHSLFVDKLTGYLEYYDVGTANSETTHAAFIDTGLIYQILPNAEIDLGCNFGVTDAAPDYQPFVGFSFRF
ncbi:MAG: transporter [Chthoniobacterales bacterium]|nr:transporter [Chthoniobacterales bacterium]